MPTIIPSSEFLCRSAFHRLVNKNGVFRECPERTSFCRSTQAGNPNLDQLFLLCQTFST